MMQADALNRRALASERRFRIDVVGGVFAAVPVEPAPELGRFGYAMVFVPSHRDTEPKAMWEDRKGRGEEKDPIPITKNT